MENPSYGEPKILKYYACPRTREEAMNGEFKGIFLTGKISCYRVRNSGEEFFDEMAKPYDLLVSELAEIGKKHMVKKEGFRAIGSYKFAKGITPTKEHIADVVVEQGLVPHPVALDYNHAVQVNHVLLDEDYDSAKHRINFDVRQNAAIFELAIPERSFRRGRFPDMRVRKEVGLENLTKVFLFNTLLVGQIKQALREKGISVPFFEEI